jgi:hypothetical protein
LSAAVEPIAGGVGAAVVVTSTALLPYGFAVMMTLDNALR